MTYATVSVLPDAADFDAAEATVQDNPTGNLALVRFPGDGDCGPVVIQCSGDGANILADGLEHLAAKVRVAHARWLRRKADEADRVPAEAGSTS